jgi:hypothetical protein
VFTLVTSARDISDAMRDLTATIREIHGKARGLEKHIRVAIVPSVRVRLGDHRENTY